MLRVYELWDHERLLLARILAVTDEEMSSSVTARRPLEVGSNRTRATPLADGAPQRVRSTREGLAAPVYPLPKWRHGAI